MPYNIDEVLDHHEDELDFLNMIDELSNDEKIELRNMWEKHQGIKELPRNLYYDYVKQEWIG